MKSMARLSGLKGIGLVAALALAAAGVVACSHGHDRMHGGEEPASPPPSAEAASFMGDPYPLETCAVLGDPLDSMGGPVAIVHEGREFKFCCESCAADFKTEPGKYIAGVNAAIVERQLASYPLTTCVVADDPLDAMGEPVNVVVKNRLFRLCCESCQMDITADPAKFFGKLDAAMAAAGRIPPPQE